VASLMYLVAAMLVVFFGAYVGWFGSLFGAGAGG